MGSIRVRTETGQLFFDFRIHNDRYREQTLLEDTVVNRQRLQKVLDQLESEISQGTFDYARYFPNSPRIALFAAKSGAVAAALQAPTFASTGWPVALQADTSPLFEEQVKTWIAENDVLWRRTHRRTINDIVTLHLLPTFQGKRVGQITKSDILAFRSTLAKVPGRKADTLSAKRINAIMAVLRQMLNEAADTLEFNTPYRKIKPLKTLKSDVEPFTLAEVLEILNAVRPEYRNYYVVAFFTGLRTGEINGLKWKYINFDRREILIRETVVAGEEDETKTQSSRRDIQMSEAVYQALRAQEQVSQKNAVFVFPNKEGKPLDHNNVTKRIWYPLLAEMGLKKRRPYQTRHTCATLWLAAGENPLWISRQLGHSSTEMLFAVYGRFVPNLTRQDGSAFERLLLQSGTLANVGSATPAANDTAPATGDVTTIETTAPAANDGVASVSRQENSNE